MSILLPALAIVFSLVPGIGFAAQAPLNAALGSGVGATAIPFGVGFAALVVPAPLRGEAGAPARPAQASPVLWIGGLFGAPVLWAMLRPVPVTGVLTAVAALPPGRLTAAPAPDAAGGFGIAVTPVAAGLALSRL